MSLLNYQLKNEGQTGQINCLKYPPQNSITNQWNLRNYESDEYLVQFCSDWKILHLENQLVIIHQFLQGLQSFTIELQVLYKQLLKQKVYSHIYSRTFLNKDYHILIIVGQNKLFIFDILLFDTSFSVQQRISQNIQLDYCKIYETDETIFLLTNTCRVYEIRYLNTQNIQINKADYHCKKQGFFNSLIPQKFSHIVEEEGFVGYLLLQEYNERKQNILIIAQAISNNQIKLLACSWPSLEQLCEPYIISDETVSLTSNYELSNMQFGQIDGQLYLFIISYRQHTQLQVFINKCKIYISDEITPVQDFRNLNCLMNNNNSSFKSDIIIMNNEFHILYCYKDCYYYHNNSFESFQKIEQKIYGFGRSTKNVMIATEDSFKILKQYANYYQLRMFIKPSLMRCQNKNIRNVLIEGFNKFGQGQNSTLQTKLQLQAFHIDEVNGSVNQITYDIMESPLSHYEPEDTQLQQRLERIILWKEFLKQIDISYEIMINIVESEIFLRIGDHILANSKGFNDPIMSSLEHWEMGQHYKSQFFSKLLEIEYFLQECIKLNNSNTIELFHYIYRVVQKQRIEEGMEHCQFWVQNNTWIQMMKNIFNKYDSRLTFDLYDAFLCDLSICMPFMVQQAQEEFEQVIMEVTESMLNLENEIDILTILVDKKLFRIIFRLYIENHNSSSKILQYLFNIFQQQDLQNVLCNEFIQRVVKFEKYKMQDNQGFLINFIFDQIDINNEEIQYRIYQALQNYPKLQFYFGIRIQRIQNFNHLQIPLNRIQDNVEFIYLREQAQKLY